ncbi:MAG: tetratricopeptide repeat protein [Gemmatimonadales bacterium]
MHASLFLLAILGAPGDTVPLYTNLGDHQYTITTAVPKAQAYFNQGLRLYYAFNHAEAIRAFREAQRQDPTCGMCFWGEALAWGPNINLPMDDAAGATAHQAISRAVALRNQGSRLERDLIVALAARYAPTPLINRSPLDSAWARALADIVRSSPGDIEAGVLYAEALMTLRPWNYWTAEGTLQPGMAQAIAQLEGALARNPSHPGACHFFIHAVEAVQPERAVECAERLAELMPGAGHLVHMPGHIYIRVGRYLDAIRANEHAVHADETYIRDQQPGVGVYTAGYYPHNYDFMAFAAAMAGRRAQSLAAADRLAELAAPMMAEAGMMFTQHHWSRRLQLRVRFERWEEILDTPVPAVELAHARAMWHYARGRALVAAGRLDEARADLAELQAACENPDLQGARLEFNESDAILRIAALVLGGRIEAAAGRHEAAITLLQHAARAEDALSYGEPPDWTVPVRHDLGAVLLAAGRAAEAEEAFRSDLRRFPANGWALAGLVEALEARGEGSAAREVRAELERVAASADTPMRSAKH